MTYIKWKDEVESYLVSLPEAEKQKIFSYFSEMYADKRDAGKSEAQIIEEFGAPYDVAKRILADSKESSAPAQENAGTAQASTSGGNNYNYNYYNYNYGGAPQQPESNGQQATKEAEPQEQPLPNGIPAENFAKPQPQQKPKSDAGKIAIGIILTICLIPLSIFLIGAPIGGIVQGFATIGIAAGGLVSGNITVGYTVATIGYGFVNVGLSLILLAPFSLLNKFLWKKLTAFTRGE